MDIGNRWDIALFGEPQSRIIVSLSQGKLQAFEDLALEVLVPIVKLGYVGGDSLSIPNLMEVSIKDLENAWTNSLEKALHDTSGNSTPYVFVLYKHA